MLFRISLNKNSAQTSKKQGITFNKMIPEEKQKKGFGKDTTQRKVTRSHNQKKDKRYITNKKTTIHKKIKRKDKQL